MPKGAGGFNLYSHERVPRPNGVGDVPRFLRELLGGFFSRFAYIVALVWQSGRWILLLLTFMALFRGVSPVVGALICQKILNILQNTITQGALGQGAFMASPIFMLLVFFFVYRVLVQTVEHINRALNRIAGERVVKTVKCRIMERSKTLDIASFDDASFYEKMENANREAGSRPLQILTETFGVFSTVIEFFSYLFILLAFPGLGAATLGIVLLSVPSAIINFIYRKKNFAYMRHRSKERRQMSYYSDLLVDKDLIKEVRILSLADTFISRYKAVFSIYYKGLRRLILEENLWHVLISLVSAGANLVFYVLVARGVFMGTLLIGDYTLLTGAITSVAACVNALITSSASIYEGTLFIDNLITFMNEPSTLSSSVSSPRRVEKGIPHRIEFVDVSFRYPGTERYILKNLSVTLRPGEMTALVGLNGAGKTTFIKLLLRLYDPTSGNILLDGHDLKEYDLQSLHSAFGTVFQDYGKYAFTVEENIRFGDVFKNGGGEFVEAAAEQSGAGSYIQKLPQGYDTPLMRIFEESGIELSGGQWQKLAVARAFYGDKDILVLDEPTASLDPMAEQELFERFEALRQNKTTLFVSHRLSGAAGADHIVVLENGTVVQEGSHNELMSGQGRYKELFSTQAKRYISSELAAKVS